MRLRLQDKVKTIVAATLFASICPVAVVAAVFLGVSIPRLGETTSSSCTPPPGDFVEADLVGTWVAHNLDSTDTLILRDDRMYKQIIHIDRPSEPPFAFESEWQSWDVEYAEGGPPYLHLPGMRLCVSDTLPDPSCVKVGGGERDSSAYNENFHYDFCRGAPMLMIEEGILLITGIPERFEQPPRGIRLALLVNCTDCGAFTYELDRP
jgi:hypothetical protein